MALKGIDISTWQKNIDYSKLKNDGIQFAILREGFGTTIDNRFLEHINGLKKNNIPIAGVYHFCYSLNENQALEEAKACVANVQKAGLGKYITIFFDFEYDTVNKAKKQGVTLGKSQCTSFTVKFCEYIKSQGYKPGVYCNLDYYKNMYDTSKIKDYTLWLAHYNNGATPKYPCVFHQYSSSGAVQGISGNVDMNLYYGDDKALVGSQKPSEDALRQMPASWLAKYLGIKEGSTGHKEILKIYNDSKLCTRHIMTVSDAWCATAVSAAFIASGLADIFPCVECSCNAMIRLAKSAGIWIENDAYVPKPGDVVLYDWDDNGVGDNVGSSDHVGLVVSVSGSSMKIIEGNYSNTVKYRTLKINGRYIRGFITPKYNSVFSTPTPIAPTTTTSTQGGFNMAILKQIKQGSTGAIVRSLQSLLNGKNSSGLAIDGSFGPATNTAVRNYQKKKNLEVDGIVGPKTWESLLIK